MTEAMISNKSFGGIGRLSIVLMLGVLAALTSSAQAAPFAYITDAGSNTVSVIDTATNTVVATVPVGIQPVAFGEFIQRAPTSPEQCKKDGWMQFNTPRTFKNQGDCIRFVSTGL